jgi:hypothetical protein
MTPQKHSDETTEMTYANDAGNEVVGSVELIEEALRQATPVTICSQNVTDD